MTERPEITIQHQAAFTDDGGLELTEEHVETSLEDFGADVSHRDQETRLDRPAASEFGVDGRVEVRQSEADNTDRRPCSRIRPTTSRRSRARTPACSSFSMTEHQPPRANAKARVLALAAATPDPPTSGKYAHGEPRPRCEAAVLTGRFDEKGEQFLEFERCLYRPTGAGHTKGD